ncbi:MAG: hypothetical protein IJM45_08145 [Clostridia bacterium]|nr:hypothetical protein [Clostridia bacterium]
MYNITIRPDRHIGPIRDLHGVGGGPVTNHFTYDASEDFIKAGIPFCRTHDIEYPFGAGEFVDIHCIFKDFDKDENDPASYNFTFTDEYLKAIAAAGAKPFYRLGTTIEHQPVKLYIHPPKDYEKWGRICSRIVAHYNDGWADGFHMGIGYWEIFNEPDIGPCWTGTEEQFIELYAAAAPIIKREHPDVKVGGCAFADPCGSLANKWLAAVRDRGLPMDFFSWHAYLYDPRRVTELSSRLDALLEKYGFAGTESIFDEWNYVVRWDRSVYRCYELHRDAFECAFMAATMAEMQNNTRIEKAMYYDVQMCLSESWNGVFAPTPSNVFGGAHRPARRPGYYALYAWNELKKLGTQVETVCDCPDVYAVAAVGKDGRISALVSYYNDEAGFNNAPPPPAEFKIDAPECRLRAFIVDSSRTFEPVDLPDGILRLDGNSCALITSEE